MSRRLYIYYRMAERDLIAAVPAIVHMQTHCMAAAPGLQAELLRRPGVADSQVTLMEAYAAPQGVDDALQARIEAAFGALGLQLMGPRHAEVFEPLR